MQAPIAWRYYLTLTLFFRGEFASEVAHQCPGASRRLPKFTQNALACDLILTSWQRANRVLSRRGDENRFWPVSLTGTILFHRRGKFLGNLHSDINKARRNRVRNTAESIRSNRRVGGRQPDAEKYLPRGLDGFSQNIFRIARLSARRRLHASCLLPARDAKKKTSYFRAFTVSTLQIRRSPRSNDA